MSAFFMNLGNGTFKTKCAPVLGQFVPHPFRFVCISTDLGIPPTPLLLSCVCFFVINFPSPILPTLSYNDKCHKDFT